MDRWTFLAVHCLRPHASTAGSMDLIPGQRSSACHVVWPKKEKYWKDICCCSVVSDSLRPHGLQHPRLPCPSPSPRASSNPRPLSRWCHPTGLFSVASFSSYPPSFPASGSFPVSWLFESGGQCISQQYMLKKEESPKSSPVGLTNVTN